MCYLISHFRHHQLPPRRSMALILRTRPTSPEGDMSRFSIRRSRLRPPQGSTLVPKLQRGQVPHPEKNHVRAQIKTPMGSSPSPRKESRKGSDQTPWGLVSHPERNRVRAQIKTPMGSSTSPRKESHKGSDQNSQRSSIRARRIQYMTGFIFYQFQPEILYASVSKDWGHIVFDL
jgi:hypothetical protein